jgi:hypothetical protein
VAYFRSPSTSTAPDFTGLQINTAVTTLPVPMIMGQTKASVNVIYYSNFQQHGAGDKGSGGKGGLFGDGGSTETTYSADIMLALCEGPIAGIGRIWRDESVYTLAGLGLTLFDGATPQAVWGYLAASNPSEAVAYWGTAYVCAASYNLGTSATIGNHNFEVIGLLAGTGVNGIDADPAQCINLFLTSLQFGAGFLSTWIDSPLLFGASGDSSVQTYCRALGIAFSPALIDQESASSVLSRWLQIINCAGFWSEGLLKIIPYGDTAIPGSTQRTTTAVAIVPTAPALGYPYIVVCGASEFVSDGGVINANTKKAFTYIGARQPTAAGTYGISAAGTYLFSNADGDAGTAVQITFTYLTGYSFNPNLTPIYSLTDDDYIAQEGEDPIKVIRADPYTLPTIQRLEVLSRSNRYTPLPVEARDQSQIELLGARVGPTIQAHEVCDEINIGPIVAQTILQRLLYVRRTFSWKLDWCFIGLEPMDIVELNDSNLGLVNQAVRITEADEDDDGIFTFTAEELTVGVSTPVLYQSGAAAGSTMNTAIAAEPVNSPPLIYEPPANLTADTLQLWLGASGGSGGVVDPNWGGCNVLVSVDGGASYSPAGVITQALRQGVLTANLALASGFDTTNTLSVNLAESGGELIGASQASAEAGGTLALVDGELLAYETATLVSGNAYNLTGLARGLDSTTPASHLSGAQFARLDGAVLKLTFPVSMVGQTIQLKFQSFNMFNGGQQALSTCAVYNYTFLGTALAAPLAPVTAVYPQYTSGFLNVYWDEVVDPRGTAVYEIRKGTTETGSTLVRTQAHPPFVVPGEGTFWIAAKITMATGLTVYSSSWASIAISANQLGGTIIDQYNEQGADWPGALQSGLAIVGTGAAATLELNSSGSPTLNAPYYYTSAQVVNLGYVAQAQLNYHFNATGSPVGQNVLTMANILAVADLLGTASAQYVSAWVEVNIATSETGGTPNWQGWQKCIPGVQSAQWVQYRLALQLSSLQAIAACTAFSWSVSVPGRVDHYQNQSCSSSGLTISFTPDGASGAAPFNAGPNGATLPYISIDSWNQTTGEYAQVTSLSLSAVTIKFYNSSGTAIAMTGINFKAEGV